MSHNVNATYMYMQPKVELTQLLMYFAHSLGHDRWVFLEPFFKTVMVDFTRTRIGRYRGKYSLSFDV